MFIRKSHTCILLDILQIFIVEHYASQILNKNDVHKKSIYWLEVVVVTLYIYLPVFILCESGFSCRWQVH